MRYHVKEKAISLSTDDFVIRDDSGNVLYDVRGDIFRIGDSFSIRDKETGNEVVEIKQRIFAYTKQYHIYSGGEELATVRKKPGPHERDLLDVSTRDSVVLYVRGDFKEWDFTVVDHYGRLLGHISREFAFFGDSYTVDVPPGVDGPFILALAIILDEIREDGGKD
jgi:uncharacterized protein YxjI